jgi:hypothetical protein
MFTIAYGIKPDLRDRYLEHVRVMKQHFTATGKKNYSVYESKGKKNQFTEVFVTDSIEEFDALEDNQDDQTQTLVSKLDQFIDEHGMRYTTLIEAF